MRYNKLSLYTLYLVWGTVFLLRAFRLRLRTPGARLLIVDLPSFYSTLRWK